MKIALGTGFLPLKISAGITVVEAYTVGVLATFYDQAIVVQESGLSDWLMFSPSGL